MPAARPTPEGAHSGLSEHPLYLLGMTSLLLALAAFLRLPVTMDYALVDETRRWIPRTIEFWAALEEGRWKDTYQSPHPGVSLMWSAGLLFEWFDLQPYGPHLRALGLGRMPAVMLGSLVPAFTFAWIHHFWRHVPRLVPLAVGILLATEPLMVAASRFMHLNMMATSLTWVGWLFCLQLALDLRKRWAILAGAVFALAALTRLSVAPVILAGGSFSALVMLHQTRQWRTVLLRIALMGGVFLILLPVLWPALAVDPWNTISQVLGQTQAWSSRPHPTLHEGAYRRVHTGPIVYAEFLLARASPELLVLATLGLCLAFRPGRGRLAMVGTLAAYLPFVLVLCLAPKKTSPYLMPVYPALALFAGIAVDTAWRLLKTTLPTRSGRAGWSQGLVAIAMLTLIAMTAGRVWRIEQFSPSRSYRSPLVARAPSRGVPWFDIYKDFALYIRQQFPLLKPLVYPKQSVAYYTGLWLDSTVTTDPNAAHFIIEGIQRPGQRSRARPLGLLTPNRKLRDYKHKGTVAATLYAGPRFSDKWVRRWRVRNRLPVHNAHPSGPAIRPRNDSLPESAKTGVPSHPGQETYNTPGVQFFNHAPPTEHERQIEPQAPPPRRGAKGPGIPELPPGPPIPPQEKSKSER